MILTVGSYRSESSVPQRGLTGGEEEYEPLPQHSRVKCVERNMSEIS